MKRMIDDKIINKLSIENDVLEIDGAINADKITGDEIVENMSGYSATLGSQDSSISITNIYASCVKNGNKITFVVFLKVKVLDTLSPVYRNLCKFNIPNEILDKLYPLADSGSLTGVLSTITSTYFKDLVKSNMKEIITTVYKVTGGIQFTAEDLSGLTLNEDYYVRIEHTFLLSDNLIS